MFNSKRAHRSVHENGGWNNMNKNLLHAIDTKTTEIENKVGKTRRHIKKATTSVKVKILCILTGGILAGLVFMILFMRVSAWYDVNKVSFQLPIIFRSPILIEKRKPIEIKVPVVVTPTPTPPFRKEGDSIVPNKQTRSEYDIVMASNHGEVLWKIYMLESTRGKNDGCRNNRQGYAGFGVMYAGEVVCYPTFEKAVERANYWLTNLGVDKNLASALCMWNTGKPNTSCSYYQSFIDL